MWSVDANPGEGVPVPIFLAGRGELRDHASTEIAIGLEPAGQDVEEGGFAPHSHVMDPRERSLEIECGFLPLSQLDISTAASIVEEWVVRCFQEQLVIFTDRLSIPSEVREGRRFADAIDLL